MSVLWIGALIAFIWFSLFFYFCFTALANLRNEVLNLTAPQQRQQ